MSSAHDLFAVDPSEFVAARDALARELKASGQRDEAAEVKALRRPSVPTWALNRVAIDHPDVVGALLTAAASARSVQERAIEGDADGDALRGALADRRAAVRDVLARAGEVIAGSGRPAATQQRALETMLTAVIASDRLSELLRTGELVEPQDDEADDDLASLLSASVPARSPAKKPAAKKPPAKQAPEKKAEPPRPSARVVAAHAAIAKAEKALAVARDDLDTATRNVETATLAENDAQQAYDAAQEALDRARAALEDDP